jgi:hypothetical protein
VALHSQHSMKISDNKEFITSDRWKCNKSPGGAHYWMIQKYEMTCRYCNYIKPVNTAALGWTKPEVK